MFCGVLFIFGSLQETKFGVTIQRVVKEKGLEEGTPSDMNLKRTAP